MLKPLARWWHIQDDMRKIVIYVERGKVLRPFFAWSKLSLIEIKLRFVPSTLINPSCLFLSDSWCDGNFPLPLKLKLKSNYKIFSEFLHDIFIQSDDIYNMQFQRKHKKLTVTSKKKKTKNFNNFITQTSQK